MLMFVFFLLAYKCLIVQLVLLVAVSFPKCKQVGPVYVISLEACALANSVAKL